MRGDDREIVSAVSLLLSLNKIMSYGGYEKMEELNNDKCPICKCELFLDNAARWDIPNTPKHNTLRLDSQGKNWCQKCGDEFDSIDFSE